MLFTIIVDAQWYQRQYGVNDINELNEEYLKYSLQKAESNVKTGKILTYTGIGLGTVGLILGVHATSRIITDPFSSWDAELAEVVTGEILLLGGMGTMAVGIPLWSINASRRNKINVALIKFNSSSYLGFKQPSTFGLSITINL